MIKEYRVPVSDADRTMAGLALHMVGARTGAAPGRMEGRSRLDPRSCRARWLAMYLTHVSFGWSLEHVAHAFGLNRATASTACRWAEDERDRPAMDALLTELEACIQAVTAGARVEIAA